LADLSAGELGWLALPAPALTSHRDLAQRQRVTAAKPRPRRDRRPAAGSPHHKRGARWGSSPQPDTRRPCAACRPSPFFRSTSCRIVLNTWMRCPWGTWDLAWQLASDRWICR